MDKASIQMQKNTGANSTPTISEPIVPNLTMVSDADSSEVQIGRHKIGPGLPTFLIAEVAQAHDGSLGFAHAFVDAVAKTGADAVKFQTHVAAAESTLDEPFSRGVL